MYRKSMGMHQEPIEDGGTDSIEKRPVFYGYGKGNPLQNMGGS